MVISPEHPMVDKWKDLIGNFSEVEKYREEALRKSDFERTELVKEKTGVRLDGVMGINPVNGKEIPIFISDYVLMTYGTGAIMAVPAHDDRDWDFAKKFSLPIITVVAGGNAEEAAYTDCAEGEMVNSEFLNGLSVAEAKEKIIAYLTEEGIGKEKVNYKLRDWVFSRQRYWGEPIPMVNCPDCGWVPVDEKDLPLTLPDVESYQPTDNGESPLSTIESFVNTTCPKCGKAATRETDTMPQWAGSSWYYLRYCDPNNDSALASKEALNYWGPVDWYNGGMEHTTLHLLYSRFWHKFLYDIGVVPTKEPYAKRTSHGMILGENGEKMSKSRGNVVNPDDIIEEFGADTLRIYEMFIGDFEKAAPWSVSSVKGCKRFLERIWSLLDILTEGEEYTSDLESLMHKTIKKVSYDIENLKFNTAIASLMSLLNAVSDKGSINKAEFKTFMLLLNPFAPHITEELLQLAGFGVLAEECKWPEYSEEKCKESTLVIPVQINGKLRSKLSVSADKSEEDIINMALSDEKVAEFIAGKTVLKKIYVKGRLLNIVVK